MSVRAQSRTFFTFKNILCVLAIFFYLTSFAQNGTEFLWQPSVQVNFKTDSRWAFNFGTEYRNTVSEALGDSSADLESQHFQLSHNTSYEVGFYAKLGLGIMYRFRDVFQPESGNELRLTQLYNYAKSYNDLRLGHRLRADQRLYKDETVYRFRYRIAVDMPLNGLKLDNNEFYVVISSEALSSFSTQAKPEIDQRFLLGLGYQLFNNAKFQCDLEYRFENYFNDTEKRLLVNTGLVFSL